jgi:hypothetical protein
MRKFLPSEGYTNILYFFPLRICLPAPSYSPQRSKFNPHLSLRGTPSLRFRSVPSFFPFHHLATSSSNAVRSMQRTPVPRTSTESRCMQPATKASRRMSRRKVRYLGTRKELLAHGSTEWLYTACRHRSNFFFVCFHFLYGDLHKSTHRGMCLAT